MNDHERRSQLSGRSLGGRKIMTYPRAANPSRVGTYPAAAKAGGGFVWDAEAHAAHDSRFPRARRAPMPCDHEPYMRPEDLW